MYAQQQQLRVGRRVSASPLLRTHITLCSRSRHAVHKILCAAAPVEAPPAVPTPPLYEPEDETRAFPYPLPMDPLQKSLVQIPLALFYPAMLACIGVSGLVGTLVGKVLPGSVVSDETKELVSVGAAGLMGAGAAYAAVQAKKKRESAAVVDLYNTIVDLPEPYELTPDMVSAVGSKFGVNMHKDELDGLARLYGQYLEALIPVGEGQLKGGEAENVLAFKEALGLSDEDAAPQHVEVARRLYRQGFETKDRQQQWEQRKAFQRLVYVSQLVFGDQKAAYLLSWRSHFPLTEAQLYVARRDNARAIFKARFSGELPADREQLRRLREMQQAVKMFDESAEEVFREAARTHVEEHLTTAINAIKATGKNKDTQLLVSEVEYVLEYCQKMAQMAGEEDMIPGLTNISVKGGPLADGLKAKELRDVYKTYLEEKMERMGEISAALDDEAKQMQAIFCMGAKEAQVMRDEVAAKLYRKLLKEEVTSKRIDQAASPDTVLQQLRDKVRFNRESALALHKQLYRAKLAALMEKGRLTEQDQQDLKRIRHILCIPDDVAKRAARETCGKVLEDTIGDIFMGGAKPVPSIEMNRLERVIQDFAIEPEVALEVLSTASRDRFYSYLMQAQKERDDRREAAGLIKKLVQFNLLVVTPMLDRIKGMDVSTHTIQPKQSIDDDDDRRGQSEINVKDDIDERTRKDLYKNYLMYTMTGDVVELPVGGMFRKKNNSISREAEVLRLAQLADLLGMSQQEVAEARRDMAESAYKAQVSDVMDGPMTQERVDYLEELRIQLGLDKETAEKVVKAAKSEMRGTSAIQEAGGLWTLERVLEVHRAGGSMEGVVEESTRRNIFRRALEKAITDGSGSLDAEFFLKKLPAMLAMTEGQVRNIVKELVASRKRMLLVQAVSQFRQKRQSETVGSLQNLISCVRVLPEAEPMQWSERAELKDIFQVFCAWESSHGKRVELQSLLGLSDEEAKELGSGSDSEDGQKPPADGEEEFF